MTEIKDDTTENRTVQHTSSVANQAIDIERLAEKVYQLLCEELRLDRARGDARRLRS
jgi:hypothetical protein